MVESRTERGDKIETEQRSYISSRALTAAAFADGARGHWRIENNLHWTLDVTFNEDQSRLRAGHGAKNMAVVRHFALNLVRYVADKRSIKRRRKCAAWAPTTCWRYWARGRGNLDSLPCGAPQAMADRPDPQAACTPGIGKWNERAAAFICLPPARLHMRPPKAVNAGTEASIPAEKIAPFHGYFHGRARSVHKNSKTSRAGCPWPVPMKWARISSKPKVKCRDCPRRTMYSSPTQCCVARSGHVRLDEYVRLDNSAATSTNSSRPLLARDI